MKKVEIIEEIKKTNRPGVGQLGDKKLAAIVQSVYHSILENVASAEGKVTFPGLGSFLVRNAERELDGEKSMVQRIAFKPAKLKTAVEKRERRKKKTGGDPEAAAE